MKSRRFLALILIVSLIVVLISPIGVTRVQAAPYNIDPGDADPLTDTGHCTFREAMAVILTGVVGSTSCPAPDGTEVVNLGGKTISLLAASGGTIDIDDNVGAASTILIQGPGTIDASGNGPQTALQITSISVTFDTVNFTGLNSTAGSFVNMSTGSNIIKFTKSAFTGNTASNGGAAIEGSANALTITTSTFDNNKSTNGDGGAINTSSTVTNINGGSFGLLNGNTANGSGGAIYLGTGIMNINGVAFLRNTANGTTANGQGGGAIFNSAGLLNINGSDFGGPVLGPLGSFFGNSAPNGRGGAIYNNASADSIGGNVIHNIQDSAFLGNSAADEGGAVFSSGPLDATRLSFVQNSSTNSIQAFADGSINDDVMLSNSTVTSSSGAAGQGAVGVKSVQQSGQAGTLTLINNTILKNGAVGLFETGSGGVHVVNTIVAQNTGADCSIGTPINFVSQGFNIESATSCNFTAGNDQQNVSVATLNLGSLAPVGINLFQLGYTPQTGSSAILGGSNAVCAATPILRADQASIVGLPLVRPAAGGGNCTVGSIEIPGSSPTIAKAFNLATIIAGGTSTITFTLTNTNFVNLTNASFSDNLVNMAISGPQAATGSCVGVGSNNFANGATALNFTGLTIPGTPGGGSCTVSVIVTSSHIGINPNSTSGVSSNEVGTGPASPNANLTVTAATMTKGFTSPITVGQNSTLTITLNNAAGNPAQPGLAFTDTLPNNLVLASAPTVVQCNGTVTGVANTSTITFTGGSLNAGPDSCQILATVTSSVPNTYVNSTAANNITGPSVNLVTTGVTASLTVNPLTAPTTTKSFAPNPIGPNGVSTLTIIITNPNAGNTINGVTFSDTLPTLPAAMKVAATPNASTLGCGAGNFTPAANDAVLNFGNTTGGTILPNGTCTIKVDVTAPTAGQYDNTTSAITSANASPGAAAAGSLTVNAGLSVPTTTKSFAPSPIGLNGVSTLTIVITNPNAGNAITGVTFSDTLPTVPGAMKVAATPNASAVGCGAGNFTPAANDAVLNFGNTTAGTILAGATCTIKVDVTAPAAGQYDNTTSTITTTNAGTGAAALGSLKVSGAPTTTKSFAPNPIGPNGVSTLTIIITNPNVVNDINGVTFSDTLPTIPGAMKVAATPNASAVGCGAGNFTPAAGDAVLNFGNTTAGTILAGATCTLKVDVTAPTAGKYDNTTSTITTTNAGTGAAALGSLTVNATLSVPTTTKSFAPNPIAANGVSTLTIVITNPNGGNAITGVTFSDTLPTVPGAMVVAATPNASAVGCGAGNFTPAANDAALHFGNTTAGTILAGATCTIKVDVTAPKGGTYNNTTSKITTTNAGTGAAAAGSLTVNSSPTTTKSFAPNPIGVNGVSTLTIVITNPNAGSPITGVTFSDTLPTTPGAMVVAATPNASAVGCGAGNFTPAANDAALHFGNTTAGTILAGATCTIKVDVTAPTAGKYNNTTSTITTTNVGTGAAAAGSLIVNPLKAPTTTKSFAPNPIGPNGVSTLTIVITNPNAGSPITGVTFSDTLPTVPGAMVVAATPNASAVGCGAGNFTPAANDAVLNFGNTTAGTILAGATCTIKVDVTAPTGGKYNNTTSTITTTDAGTGAAAAGSLTVNPLKALTTTKSFAPNPIAPNGVSTLTIVITNPNAGNTINGVTFSDTLPTVPGAMVVAATPNASAVGCGAGNFTPAAGNAVLNFGNTTAGTILAGATCTIKVDVTAPTLGKYTNTTSTITTTNAGTGAAASGSLTVNPLTAPTTTKSFAPNPISVNGVSTLTIVITNPNGGNAITGVTFSDTLPTVPGAMVVAATPNASAVGCGAGNFTPAANDAVLNFGNTTAGTILAGATCTIKVDVTAPTLGKYTNTTSTITTTNTGTGAAASGILNINPLTAPTTTKSFAPNPIGVNGVSTLTIVITNPNGGNAITGVTFSDTLPTVPGAMVVAATPNASAVGCGAGNFTPAANDAVLNFGNTTAGTILAGATCTIKVDVTAPTAGKYNNTTSKITTTNTGQGAAAAGSLTVNAGLSVPTTTKTFSPIAIGVNGVSTLTIVITNPNGGNAITGVTFSDTLPTVPGAMVVAATPNASTVGCGAGNFTPAANDAVLNFGNTTAGTILAGATCTLKVDVTAPTAGKYTNTTSTITTTNAGTGAAASGSLTVVAPNTAALSKAFNPTTIVAGQTSTLTFTITNPTGSAAQNGVLGFTDTLPAGLTVSGTPATPQCGGAVAGAGQVITLAGGTIGVGPAACTITVTVTSSTPKTYVNNATNVTGIQGSLSAAGVNATLIVTGKQTGGGGNQGGGNQGGGPQINIADPEIAKTSDQGIVFPGSQVTFTLTVTNSGGQPANGVVVTDPVPGQMSINKVSSSQGTYTVSGNTVTFTIGTVNPGQVITMGIVATVSGNVSAQGCVTNTSTLAWDGGSPRNGSATVCLTRGTLPATGEHPDDPASPLPWLLVAVVGVILASGLVVLRRRVRA